MEARSAPFFLAVFWLGVIGWVSFPARAEEVLRMHDLIGEVDRRSPEIRAAWARYEQAQRRIVAAYGLEDPMISAERWPTGMVMAGIEQDIPFPAKLGVRGRIARAETQMALQDLRDVRLKVHVAAMHLYHHLWHIDREIEINDENEEILDRLTRSAEAHYVGGGGAEQDVVKAQLEKTLLVNEGIKLAQEKATYRADLNALLDRPMGTAVGTPEGLMPQPITVPVAALQGIAEEHRPMILRAEARVERAKAEQAMAAWAFAPDFDVKITRFYDESLPGGQGWGAMGGIRIPLWAPVRQAPLLGSETQGVAAAEANLTQALDGTRADVASGLARLDAARASLALYKDQLIPQAEQSFQAALASYTIGQRDFLNLLDAQRTLREIRLGYYRTIVDYEMRLDELELAVGVDIHAH